ncbi:transposase DDE domain protein [Bacillus clarus]|uniref:Transposase DDE domain protein n=1 Tax=Bacillus clarus TaxID=2338372 RepID=A0A090YBW7_9BACI|nr:transposase DDE domain protein [Bacillus clarus]
MGYFSLEDLDQMDQRGTYYISRLKLNTNVYVKNVVCWSEEGETLESFTTNSKWKYIKKEDRHHVVQFIGYDNSEKEHV